MLCVSAAMEVKVLNVYLINYLRKVIYFIVLFNALYAPRRRSAKTVDDSPVPVTFARGEEIGLSGGETTNASVLKESVQRCSPRLINQ